MISQRLRTVIPGIALVLATLVTWSPANAQAPTLLEQLAAQYKVAKMGSDSSGWSVVQEGTVLAVQKGGILGVPYKTTLARTATYQDGTVRTSGAAAGHVGDVKDKLCGVFKKCPTTPDTANDEMKTQLFKVGDKVYPTKIEVKLDKDQVAIGIVACDTCNKTDPPTYNKAQVVFQFAKGSLAKAGAGEVEDTIGQLLSISEDTGQGDQQGDQQGGQDQGQGQGQQAQQQQAEPQSIEKGMTMDQVQAALGKPEKIVNLGIKQLYIYKDMKVTFIAGKVADVQ
jgi:hypothetical protein